MTGYNYQTFTIGHININVLYNSIHDGLDDNEGDDAVAPLHEPLHWRIGKFHPSVVDFV